MPGIKLVQPTSLDDALSLLAEHGSQAKVIAGGTALVIMLRNRLLSPSTLVSLDRLDGLHYIRGEPGTGLRIGTLVTIREAEVSRLIREKNPTMAETFGKVGNIRVRYAATVGGNISEADYASDPPCVLVAMRGKVRARSVRGEREIPAVEFFRGFYETSLAPDEILTEVIVPELSPTARSTYVKYASGTSEDRPCVGVAVVADCEPDGRCKELRVVIGAVAETPQEIRSAEEMALGQHLTDELIDEIARAYASGITPLSDVRGSDWYRKRIIRVLVKRAIMKVLTDDPAPAD